MKHLYLTTLFVSAFLGLSAQDTIYYLRKTPEVVKIIEINPGKIRYKQWDYQDGPDYIIPRRDVTKISSANGKVTWINEDAWEKDMKATKRAENIASGGVHKVYARNMVSFSPVVVQSTGFGVGMAYEHMSADGIFGFRLPVNATFYNPGVYFLPGLRVYPFGQRTGTFFLTPSVYGGYGERELQLTVKDKYGKDSTYYGKKSDFQFGFFLETGFHFHMTPEAVVSLSVAGGVNYLDLTKPNSDVNAPFGKFEVGFGYRFGNSKKKVVAGEVE